MRQNAERAMALLEERFHAGLSTKAALKLALDCCRALQQPQRAGNGGQEEEDQADSDTAMAVDVALISPEGVRLVERLSPPDLLLGLVSDEDGGEGEE